MTNFQRIKKYDTQEFISFLCDACNDCSRCICSSACRVGHTGFLDSPDYVKELQNLPERKMAERLCMLRTGNSCDKCPVKNRCMGVSGKNGYLDYLLDDNPEFVPDEEEEEYFRPGIEEILRDYGLSIRDFI